MVPGQTVMAWERIWKILKLGTSKVVECCLPCLMGHLSRNLKDSNDVDYGSPVEEV